jgi:hypothetical protein
MGAFSAFLWSGDWTRTSQAGLQGLGTRRLVHPPDPEAVDEACAY